MTERGEQRPLLFEKERDLFFKTVILSTQQKEKCLEISFIGRSVFHLKVVEDVFFGSDGQCAAEDTGGADLLNGVFVQFVAVFLSDETHLSVQLIVAREIEKSTMVLLTGKDANHNRKRKNRSRFVFQFGLTECRCDDGASPSPVDTLPEDLHNQQQRRKRRKISPNHKFRIANGNGLGDEFHFLAQFLHDLLKERRQFTRGGMGHQDIDVRTGLGP